MRICTPHVSLSPESNSGGEVYEREMLTHLGRLGAQLDVILPGQSRYPADVQNWTVHRTWLPRGFRWYISNLIFPGYIKQVYDRHGFDLLRIHSLRFVGPACLWAKYRHRLTVPLVAHHHHIDPEGLSYLVDQRVARQADWIITVSQFSKRQLVEEFGVSAKKISVIYNGVNRKFTPQPADQILQTRWHLQGKQVILFLGGLKPRKNLEFLFKVFAKIVAQRGADVCLLIAGDGPLRSRLEQLADQLGLRQQVIFAGFIPEQEKVRTYNLADVVVCPSRLEGFGLVPAEAMSCGVPVVANDAGALSEVIIDTETGYLVDQQDLDLFAQYVLMLLEDAPLRSRLGQAAQQRVESLFRWDEAARQLLAVYEQVVTTQKERYA